MNFRIARAANKTGATLQTMVEAYLRENGFTGNVEAEICYGVGYTGSNPALNAKCSALNKYEQSKVLRQHLGVNALDVLTPDGAKVHMEEHGTPLFGRKIVHAKGKDIKIALEAWQIDGLVASGIQFFTPHVPSVREFRTWVYRKRHLGTYEKVMRRPQDCTRLGRNYANGFDFSGLDSDNVPDALKDVARKAIAALDLDFGAVDILQKADGTYVVLEVNSAPGVGDERRKVIVQLCKRIGKWIMADCPRRANDA